MKIGFLGFGKLGLPVGYTFASKGHDVYAYDLNPEIYKYVKTRKYPHREEGLAELMQNNTVTMVGSVAELTNVDLLFVPIQTPHKPEFEGDKPLTGRLADFDYTSLIKGFKGIVKVNKGKLNVVIISTVLPGTLDKHILPLLNKDINLIYQPMFIAMGTVVKDTLEPEFILCGTNGDSSIIKKFYSTVHDKPVFETDIKTAEGIKVFYNTAITSKILLANAWMQVAHKTGMNVDDISKALSMATDRIISGRYMSGGGPDAGGCHPRDLIALSWLGEEISLKPNWFFAMAQARDLQTEWTADLLVGEHDRTKLPIVILGKAFKPETNITTGSGATLLRTVLERDGFKVKQYDPHTDKQTPKLVKSIFLIATKHEVFKELSFPKGSVVVDLFRYIPKQEGVRVIHVGGIIEK